MPADPFRLLVTGPRNYPWPGVIQDALLRRRRENPGRPMLLVHGQCDPRHPVTGEKIRWSAAECLSPVRRLELHGADWLASELALSLGWATEPHPADWKRWRGAAGPRRNAEMTGLGAHAADAFLGPCVTPGCHPEPHLSHGTADCIGRADRAGIPVRRHEHG